MKIKFGSSVALSVAIYWERSNKHFPIINMKT